MSEYQRSNENVVSLVYGACFYTYTISYILFSASNINQITSIGAIATAFNFFCIVCLIVVILMTPKSLIGWLEFSVCAAIGFLTYMYTGESIFLFFVLFCCVEIPGNSNYMHAIFRRDILVRIFLILFVLVLGLVNVIPSTSSVRMMISSGAVVARSSFGFAHPNVLGALFLSLIAEWTYLRKEKMTILEIVFLLFMVFIENEFINVRSSTIIAIFILIGAFLLKTPINIKIKRILQSNLILYAYVLGLVISIFIANSYVAGNGMTIWDRLNKLFSGRIGIFQFYLSNMHFSLFPQQLPTYELTGETALDNTYLYLLLHFGLLALILFQILVLVKGINLRKRNDIYGLLIWFSFSLFSLMEGSAFYPAINILLTFRIKEREK